MADLAIEETNRIRASLGMKPLPVPSTSTSTSGPKFASKPSDSSASDSDSEEEEEEQGSTLESRQAQGYDNWKSLQDEHNAKRKREEKAAAVRRAREAAQRFARLEGKGLADDDDDGKGGSGNVDTRTWLLQQKKRQKKLQKEREKAEKLEKELAERERDAGYTEKDLEGVNVAHAVEDFEGEDAQVLTLMDQTIDQNEEEGDELENLGIKEKEKLEERLGAKKKTVVYDPNAEDEGEKKMLSKYDEEIEGKKRKRFRLDGQGMSEVDKEAQKKAIGERIKKEMISLDALKSDVPISDYAEPVEAKIKKPKKKKTKTSRRKAADEDDIFPSEQANGVEEKDGAMDIDAVNGQQVPKKDTLESSFVDDDDLQASLALQRRAALKKRKKTKPEDLARQLKEEAITAADKMDEEPDNDGGLVIDETTEFVAGLERAKDDEDNRPRPKKARSVTPQPDIKAEAPESSDEEMGGMLNDTQSPSTSARLKRETSTPAAVPGMTDTGLDDEQTISGGIGGTLSMLKQRGLVTQRKEDLVAALLQDADYLRSKRQREIDFDRRARVQRERDRASGKLDHMSARDREDYAHRQNQAKAQMESRAMEDVIAKKYKPNVSLKYIDEHGRAMSQKEAFKHLSHQFHGKGSGKQKTEKHLKRIEDERSREARSLLDSSTRTGMDNAQGAMGKRRQQAGVRLG